MAKKSQRRVLQHERSQTGCMSGLIGIFDFRQARSTRKLLSDKRHVAGTTPGRGTLRLTDGSDKMQQIHEPLPRTVGELLQSWADYPH